MLKRSFALITLALLPFAAAACNNAVSSTPVPTPDQVAIYKLTVRAFDNMASLHSYHLTLSIVNEGKETDVDGDFGRTTGLFTQQSDLQKVTVLNVNEATYLSTDGGKMWTKPTSAVGDEMLKMQQAILKGVASDIEGGTTTFVAEESIDSTSTTHLQVNRYNGGGTEIDVWIGHDEQLGDIVRKIHESIKGKDIDEDITSSYSDFNKPLDLQPPTNATNVDTPQK